MNKTQSSPLSSTVSSGSAAASFPDVNIALDIETLSTRPTAAIISIAARVFSFQEKPAPTQDEQPAPGSVSSGSAAASSPATVSSGSADPFSPGSVLSGSAAASSPAPVILDNPNDEVFTVIIDASSCAMEGLHFDMDTIRWWQRRDEDARLPHTMAYLTSNIVEALNSFSVWCDTIRKAAGGKLLFWMQGTDFDAAILHNAYAETMGFPTPWKHTELRDSRTFILSTIGLLRPDVANPYSLIPKNPDWHPHEALSDVDQLIWNVRHVRQLFLQAKLPNMEK